MFGYIDAIDDNSIIKENNNFKVVWNDDLLWVTNYIRIVSYDKEQIVLKIKSNSLIIEGKELTIAMLQKKEIIIKGTFYSVSVERKEKIGK